MADELKAPTGLASVAGSGGTLEKITTLARETHGRYIAMPPARRNQIAVAALLMAAMCAGMAWYAGRADWRILFSGLDAKDTQQIAQELSAAGIAFQLTADSSGIEVEADQIEKARMEIAAKGMPQSGRMGFELFDKPNWVGSEFDEKVNYQRALEGELEHTIGTLAVVRSARVHLVLPKESLFGEGQQTAKASVVLQLRRSVLPPEQAQAVRGLLAGAVGNLSTENVTLVDADGRLNLNAPEQGAAGADAERTLEGKLIAMLEPTAGVGNVRATVNIAYDDGSEEKTDEIYDPSQTATLSLHKTEQTAGPRSRPSGIPGTASNTPGVASPGTQAATRTGAAAVPPLLQAASSTSSASGPDAGGAQTKDAVLPVYPQGGSQGNGETLIDETGSYVVTKHLLHSQQGPGRIRRISAAVLVNDRMTTEGTGKLAHSVWKGRSTEEMQRVEQLARAAVGFDTARGDQVVIENLSFSSNEPEIAPPTMERWIDRANLLFHSQAGLWKVISVSTLALILALAVLRPLTRQMVTSLSQTPYLSSATGSSQSSIAGRRTGMANFGQAGGSDAPAPRLTDAQAVYEHISEQIRREPMQSTRLLESWISAPVEEED